MALYGIDVSKHQGEIDWGRVKTDFAIIRVGYSKYAGGIVEDEYFRRNTNECERYGIPYGVYVYSYDRSIEAAKATAEDVIKIIGTRNITYPIWYDIEEVYGDNNLRTGMCNAFCARIQQAGYATGVYSYFAFFKNFLDLSALINVDKWIADYRGKRPEEIPHEMWQYTGSGVVDGISTKVDLNICYKSISPVKEREIDKLITEIKEVLKHYEHD